MEKGKEMQGRGFVVVNGQVFGQNIELGKPLRMHKNLLAELATKGDVLAQVENLVSGANLGFTNENQTQKQTDKLQAKSEIQNGRNK